MRRDQTYDLRWDGGQTRIWAESLVDALNAATELALEMGADLIEVWYHNKRHDCLTYVGSRP